MNDISLASSKFNSILYADDTTLQSTLSAFDLNNSSDSINAELKKIQDWLALNKLSLNIKKTKFMLFHTPQRIIDTPRLELSNTSIAAVSEFNFLGLTIDQHLNWKSHISRISNKISRSLGMINRLKHFIPQQILRMLYNSLILPHLNYCLLCWGFSWNRIFKLQKKAMRIITCSKYNAHTTPIFKNLGLLKINDILNLHLFKFYYKYVNNNLPVYLQSFDLLQRSDIHSHNTRFSGQLVTPRTNMCLADRCVRNYLPYFINNIPDQITEKIYTHSIQGAGNYYKTYILSTYENICNIPNCYICNK